MPEGDDAEAGAGVHDTAVTAAGRQGHPDAGHYQQFMSVGEELKEDDVEMQAAVNSKQKVRNAQEKRPAFLDAANARLISALTQLKERYSTRTHNGISPTNPTIL